MENPASIDKQEKIDSTHEQKDLIVTMDRLITAIEKLNETQKKIERQNKIGPIIIRAIIYALASTLGLSIVFAILFYLLNKLGIFGNLTDLLNSVKDMKNLY